MNKTFAQFILEAIKMQQAVIKAELKQKPFAKATNGRISVVFCAN